MIHSTFDEAARGTRRFQRFPPVRLEGVHDPFALETRPTRTPVLITEAWSAGDVRPFSSAY